MMTLKSQTEYRCRLRLKSPLLIASIESTAINIGGVDTFMARNPITGEPFIPPTSLYGKLRYLYEITKADTDKPSEYYFGSEQAIGGPAIINIKEIKLVDKNADNFMTKSENTISRYTLEASPRIYDTASEGLIFECAFLVNLYNEHSEKPGEIINNILSPLLNHLEDDYIGGCGTRGMGEIEVTNRQIGKTLEIDQTIPLNTVDCIKSEIVYLTTPLFSDNKIDSVTLAGLFAYGLATLGKTDMIKDVYNGEDLKVSSAFPFIKTKDNLIHFLPRPQIYIKGVKTHKNKKAWQYDFQYVSEEVFKEMRGCNFKNECFMEIVDSLKDDSKYKIVEDLLLMNKDEYSQLWEDKLSASADLVHLAIDAKTGFPKKVEGDKGILFSTHDHFFSDKIGFYFLISHRFDDISPLLDIICRLGIGRDKSYGYGMFAYEKSHLPESFLDITNNSADIGYLSLSLIHPCKEDREEIARGNCSYRVITRKGKRENNSITGLGDRRIEKDKIFMLKEGSVFDFEIKGYAPVVYPMNEDGYEIRDFGYSYLLRF